MLEMFRRDQFRQDLLVERCDELIALDERLQELDTLLAASVSVRRAAPAARCACGAPLVWGSHFCANCGRPAAATPPVVGCPQCGSALAADAKFCAVCGKAVTPAQQSEAAAVKPQSRADRGAARARARALGAMSAPPPSGPQCPRCGATYGPDQEYCLECGQRLDPPGGVFGRLAGAGSAGFRGIRATGSGPSCSSS